MIILSWTGVLTPAEKVKQLGLLVFQEGVAFVNEDSVQFFTVCEQKGLCKATSLQVVLWTKLCSM